MKSGKDRENTLSLMELSHLLIQILSPSTRMQLVKCQNVASYQDAQGVLAAENYDALKSLAEKNARRTTVPVKKS